MNHLFPSGVNPATGERAIRSEVYEVLTTMKVPMNTADVQALLPHHDFTRVNGALRGLVHNPDAYPHVHRIKRGTYLFDPKRTTVWTTYPQMARRRRVNGKLVTVNRKKEVAEAVTQQIMEDIMEKSVPTPTITPAPTSEVGCGFTDKYPVVTTEGKVVPQDEQVLLRDSDGRFWLAKRV